MPEMCRGLCEFKSDLSLAPLRLPEAGNAAFHSFFAPQIGQCQRLSTLDARRQPNHASVGIHGLGCSVFLKRFLAAIGDHSHRHGDVHTLAATRVAADPRYIGLCRRGSCDCGRFVV
jgi:hypothetical protein